MSSFVQSMKNNKFDHTYLDSLSIRRHRRLKLLGSYQVVSEQVNLRCADQFTSSDQRRNLHQFFSRDRQRQQGSAADLSEYERYNLKYQRQRDQQRQISVKEEEEPYDDLISNRSHAAEELSRIQQESSVMEYKQRFEKLHCLIDGEDEQFFLQTFLGGLKKEIRHDAIVAEPQSLIEAFKVALRYEAKYAKGGNGSAMAAVNTDRSESSSHKNARSNGAGNRSVKANSEHNSYGRSLRFGDAVFHQVNLLPASLDLEDRATSPRKDERRREWSSSQQILYHQAVDDVEKRQTTLQGIFQHQWSQASAASFKTEIFRSSNVIVNQPKTGVREVEFSVMKQQQAEPSDQHQVVMRGGFHAHDQDLNLRSMNQHRGAREAEEHRDANHVCL